MQTATMAGAAIAVVILSGCATGPRTPPINCLSSDVSIYRSPLTVIAPADVPADIARLEALADERYGPADELTRAWLRISDTEVRLCRWGYHRCLGSLYGTYFDFDLSGAEPVLAHAVYGACVVA